jgi:hypothetical protein
MSSLAAGFIQGFSAGSSAASTGFQAGARQAYYEKQAAHDKKLEDIADAKLKAYTESLPKTRDYETEAERAIPDSSVENTGGGADFSANAMSLHQRLMDTYKLSPEVADGVVGSVTGESGRGLDPKAYNPDDEGSPSGGAFQHHLSRLDNLKSFAKQSDVRKIPYKAQEDFVFDQELKKDYSIVGKNLQSIQAKLDTGKITKEEARTEAARVWTRDFENPKNWEAKAKERTRFAQNFTNWRMAKAGDTGAPKTVARDEGQPEVPPQTRVAALPTMLEAPEPIPEEKTYSAPQGKAPFGGGIRTAASQQPQQPAVGGAPQKPKNMSPFGWGDYLPEEGAEGFTPSSEGEAGYPTGSFTPALAMGGGVQTLPRPTMKYRAGGAVPELKQKFQFGGYSDEVDPTADTYYSDMQDRAKTQSEYNDVTSDLPPNARSMMATTARPAPEKITGAEGVKDALNGGLDFLQNVFGLKGGDTAVPQNDPQKTDRAADMLRGVGANTPEEGVAMADKIDPKRELTTSLRNAFVLRKVYEFYRDRGEHDKAQQAAAEFIQLCNVDAQRLGSLGVAASQNGDFTGAAKAVQSGYNQAPNGEEVVIKVNDPKTGKGEMITSNAETGKEIKREPITGEEIAARAAGLVNGTGYYKAMVEAAGNKLPQRKETSYDKRAGTLKQFNTLMEEAPIDYTRKDLPKTLEEALSPEQRAVYNELPTSRQTFENNQYLVRSGQKSVSGRKSMRGSVEEAPAETYNAAVETLDAAKDNVEKWRSAAKEFPEKMNEAGKAAAIKAEQDYANAYDTAKRALGPNAKEYMGGKDAIYPKPTVMPRKAVSASEPRVVAEDKPQYSDGQTATLKDGTKVVFSGGKWRAAPSSAPGGLMPISGGSFTSRPELMGQ